MINNFTTKTYKMQENIILNDKRINVIFMIKLKKVLRMKEIRLYENLPEEAKNIRKTVFMDEQGFKDEFDETDKNSLHAVLFADGKAAATARMFTEDSGKSYHIGRVAVLKEYRKSGLGSEIMTALCEKAKEKGAERCELSAQCRAKNFYTKLGFKEKGGIYLDEGCPHIYMEKKL